MRYPVVWSLFIVAHLAVFPLTAQVPEVYQHPRLEYDLRSDGQETVRWDRLEEGLKVSFGSIDELYPRNLIPNVHLKKTLDVTAWRGERVGIQLVLWSKGLVKDVRLEMGDFLTEDGGVLSPSAVQMHFVRYTLSDHPVGAVDFACDSTSSEVYLVPDVLDRLNVFDLPARSVRPIWVSVDIPRKAAAGKYEATLRIRAESRFSETLNVVLHVQRGTVPKVENWCFRLDLWQNPWAVAHYHDVRPWSEAHLAILRPHLRRLAQAGQRFITTYISHSPWTDDTHVVDSTMVESIRRSDGTFSFDYRIFDLYVQLAQECGITDAITAYTMLPWQHRIRYLDEETGKYIWTQWPPDSESFQSFWMFFLDDFRAHLIEKGWFEKTFIGINENPLQDTLASIQLLRDHSKWWKITYAGNLHEELLEVVDDYCLLIDQPITDQMILERRKRGQTTTFYVCCTPPRPNNFPFSPPAEGTWMGWHAFARGYDGFLRWAFDNWTADPLRDTRHSKWAAGDCFLVYPDQRSSIRFERLRSGFVDFEKLRKVRHELEMRKDVEAELALEKLNQMLQRFTYEAVQGEPAAVSVNAARQLLAELTTVAFGE